MKNKIVARFQDGRMIKGVTSDFFPTKNVFHVADDASGEVLEIRVPDLKAIFFVKSYDGREDAQRSRNSDRTGLGKKIMVTFKDNEMVLGYSTSYSNSAPGFFMFPADNEDNNERIFVVNAAAKNVRFL